jgi:hypothetical protein
MQAAFDPRTNAGRTFAWPELGIVAAWGIAGALFAIRRFSWTPPAPDSPGLGLASAPGSRLVVSFGRPDDQN